MEFNQAFNIFFKIFAITISLIYLMLSIVLSRQIRVMTDTLKDKFNSVITAISSLQIAIALILLIFTIFFA